MGWDLLIDTLYRLPTTSVVLVACLAFVGALMISQILNVGAYTTLASVPLLLGAGLLGNAVLMINHVTLSPDKASNVALSACLGFIVLAAMCFGAVRTWSSIHDRR